MRSRLANSRDDAEKQDSERLALLSALRQSLGDAAAAAEELATRTEKLKHELSELRALHAAQDTAEIESLARDVERLDTKRDKLRRELDSELRRAFVRLAGELSGYVAVESDGLLFVTSAADARHFRLGDTKEIRGLALALERLHERGVEVDRRAFIDVGANVGTVALSAVREGFSFVLACEPEPQSFRLLSANVALNDANDRVRALQVAVSSERGTARLAVGAKSKRKSRLLTAGEDARHGRVTEVQMASLDGLAADGVFDPRQVGLLWLDAEGHEAHVLRGASCVLERAVPLVLELNVKLLTRAGTLADLPTILTRHYTHVLDLRRDDGAFSPAGSLPELIARYEPAGKTDLLLCREPGPPRSS
jgi:FkbM family methyltransferase